MVLAAAAVCDEKKAENTRVLELDPADSGFTDFFLITSGTNTRQTVAIADDIELKMKREFGTYANSVEGRRTGEWILLDYVDFVVHIFVEEKRAFYDIERLRKSARSIDMTQLKVALTEKTAAARRTHPRPAGVEAVPQGVGYGQAEAPAEAVPAAVTLPKKAAAGNKTTVGKKATPRKTAARKAATRKTSPAKKSATRIAAAEMTASAPTEKVSSKKPALTKRARTPREES